MFKQEILLLEYNKDVVCVIDKDQFPVCTAVASPSRRNTLKALLPSEDPYIPRQYSLFYNCTALTCEPVKLTSLTQVTDPNLNLKACYLQSPEKFECEVIRFNHFKNVDKLVFLRNNIQNKTFYLVDCLIYADNGRVCHSKDNAAPHSKLVDVASLVRPQEPNVLSQSEFLCEESDTKQINCDLDYWVPYETGLQLKDTIKVKGDLLLKTGNSAVVLKRNCFADWCGYSGSIASRRRYEHPGGKFFRCYSAKKQQVCKMFPYLSANNDRALLYRS